MFCKTRWVENIIVIERALVMIGPVRKYLKSVTQKTILDLASFKTLQEMLKDKMLVAKLHFFLYVAQMLQPFLVGYQSPAPNAVFLYDDLFSLLQDILRPIIKESELGKCKGAATLLQVASKPKEEALKLYTMIDIGTGAKNAVESGCTDQVKMAFRMECQKFLLAVASKIAERCPLKYKLTRGIGALSPTKIKVIDDDGDVDLLCKRFEICIDELYNTKRVTASLADKCKQQFRAFIGRGEHFSAFSRETHRVDVAWCGELVGKPELKELFGVVRLILIMSHGNASVEQGFSMNKEMLVENLAEETLVALRICRDEIIKAGGVLKVDLSERKLFDYYGRACKLYNQALEQKRREDTEQTIRESAKRKANAELQVLEAQKRALESDTAAKRQLIDDRINATKKLLV